LEDPHLCIVTELVERGSLFDIMHDDVRGPQMTWRKCITIAHDTAQGVAYLHAHDPPILHRDLKSLNILVDAKWRAKV
jgi:serine/threonine-protein kinase CTR1